ncbi:MAG: sulfatase-like hydrolase/transferase [Alphaproteobacteria bacterium]|nr:sulfatase-like hydrolase/transferase [Alphaproteobacteria bacterium]
MGEGNLGENKAATGAPPPDDPAPNPAKPEARPGVTRKQFLMGAGVAGIIATCGPDSNPQAPVNASAQAAPAVIRGKRPNILLILTDQERAHVDLPSCLSLPNHDRLRARAVTFSNYHVTTSPCSPARSVIYTGLHTRYTKVIGNPGTNLPAVLSDTVPTIGDMLREQGYYTAYKGKWHLSPIFVLPKSGLNSYKVTTNALEPYGFSDYSMMGDRLGGSWDGFVHDRMIASEAVQWLHGRARTLDKDQPWFLAVNFVNPHDMMFFDAGGEQRQTQVLPNILQPLREAPGLWPYREDLGVDLPKSFREDDLSTKPWAHRAFAEVNDAVFGKIGDEAAWRRAQNYYFNCIRDVDQYVGVVLDALLSSGFDDDTIVIFSSDHGELAGAHRLREKGPCMYKENLRVPFIVRHPDIGAARETAALGSALDIAPTVLSFAGLQGGELASRYPSLKGADLSPAISTPGGRSLRDERGMLYYFGAAIWADPDFTRQALSSYAQGGMFQVYLNGILSMRLSPSLDRRGMFRGLYDGRYKFARYFAGTNHNTPQDLDALYRDNDVELYDTQNDPDEIHNLAADRETHRDILLRLNRATNEAVAAELLSGDRDDGAEFG